MKFKDLGDKLTKRSRDIVDDSDYTPMLGVAGSTATVETREESWGSIIAGWIKGSLLVLLGGAIFVGLVYSLLSIFLMMFVPIQEGGDRQWVIRGTWQETGGIPDIGDKAIISMTKNIEKAEWYDLVTMGFTGIPNVAVVENLSKDNVKLYINNDKVTDLSNKETYAGFTGSALFPYDLEDPEQKTELNYQLDGSMLVKCVSGACEEGSVFILDKNQIFGEQK